MSIVRTGITCNITAYEIEDAQSSSPDARKWIAKAVAQVIDPHRTVPQLTAEQTVLTGEVIRIVEARSIADTEAAALQTALGGLLFQLDAFKRQMKP